MRRIVALPPGSCEYLTIGAHVDNAMWRILEDRNITYAAVDLEWPVVQGDYCLDIICLDIH